MRLRVLPFCISVYAIGSASASIYSHGPVTHALNANLMPISYPFSSTSQFGFSASHINEFWVSDKFIVTGPGWGPIQRVSVFAFDSGSILRQFRFKSIDVVIRKGTNPSIGEVLLKLTDTPVTNGGLVGFRVWKGDTERESSPIFRLDVDARRIVLPFGPHTISFRLRGPFANEQFFAPCVPWHFDGTAWYGPAGKEMPAVDTGSGRQVSFPFELEWHF